MPAMAPLEVPHIPPGNASTEALRRLCHKEEGVLYRIPERKKWKGEGKKGKAKVKQATSCPNTESLLGVGRCSFSLSPAPLLLAFSS